MGPPPPGATRELGVVAMLLSLIDIRPEGRAVNTYESSLFTRVSGRRILSSSYPRVCIGVPLGLWVVSYRPQASDRGSQDIWVPHSYTAPWIALRAEHPLEAHIPSTVITH